MRGPVLAAGVTVWLGGDDWTSPVVDGAAGCATGPLDCDVVTVAADEGDSMLDGVETLCAAGMSHVGGGRNGNLHAGARSVIAGSAR